METIEKYFKGEEIYGDDFDVSQIQAWYDDELEGYADLGSKDRSSYSYIYHSMNKVFGFDYLDKNVIFKNALGVGSAYGEEFIPLIDRIEKITIIEPSDNLVSSVIGNISPIYHKPQVDGSLTFEDNLFDLILCFSTLHHIPNVTFVLNELLRVLNPEGYMIIREPIRTLGDWRKPRKGLTKNERGIPHHKFDEILNRADIEIVSKVFCDCNFAFKILSKFGFKKRDTIFAQKVDRFLSKILSWNIHYHAETAFQKMAPASVFYVVKKIHIK